MILVGERLNGSFQDVGRAIAQRDPVPIRRLARMQAENGADYLDLNVGTGSLDPVSDMGWLVHTVQEATECALCFDSTNFDVIEAGLKAAGEGCLINSCQAEPEKMRRAFSMAIEHRAKVIGLTMNDAGIPKDADARVVLAVELIESALEHGVEMESLFIDPLVLPLNVAQDHTAETLRTIEMIKLLMSNPPNTIIGLSNVSQGVTERSLVNRVFLVMAMAKGLDAAILDVNDEELVDSIATARVLLNQEIYAQSYLKSFRKQRI